jgi:hypothetical protein
MFNFTESATATYFGMRVAVIIQLEHYSLISFGLRLFLVETTDLVLKAENSKAA